MRINVRGLEKEIIAKGYKIVQPQAEAKVKNAINNVREQLIADFDSHPVTEEIEGGSSASNISNTLGGYGNLFSFIGFESDDDPISPIRSLLAQSIEIKSFKRSPSIIGFSLELKVPTIEEVKKVAPMPWSTDDWVDAIERGISGLGQYLHKNDGSIASSRSGKAIQIQAEIPGRGGVSSPVEYMTEIFTKMLKNIEKNLKAL
ncbi:MAG: hypothetical protein CL885_04985 [Dehalococcoidia bacterium]|nr:hypothetical protein [Dehalococcoidia bacterium]